MEEIQQLTEKEYRSLDKLSYSVLKDFLVEGRRYYYRRHILKDGVKKEMTKALLTGSLVDSILYSPQEIESTYHFSDAVKTPDGKGGTFVTELFRLMTTNPDQEFMTAFEEAYKLSGSSEKLYSSFLSKFEGSNLETYYLSLLESQNKIVVSLQDYNNAQKIANELKFGRNTKHLFEMPFLSQVPIFFEYRGKEFKSKLDYIGFDHEQKIIYPKDLKVTFDVENFSDAYGKAGYFIQEYLYQIAVEQWAKENYPDYFVEKFEFIVADSILYVDPLIYNIEVQNGSLQHGFTGKYGRYYQGVDKIMDNISWHTENNVWSSSKENYELMGKRYELI